MFAYRITETDSSIIVGTEQESILVCATREIADRVIADAEMLAKFPAKLLFSRRRTDEDELKSAAPRA